jgi:hypothetical protein
MTNDNDSPTDPSDDVRNALQSALRNADDYRVAIVIMIPKDVNRSSACSVGGTTTRLEIEGAMYASLHDMHANLSTAPRVRFDPPPPLSLIKS